MHSETVRRALRERCDYPKNIDKVADFNFAMAEKSIKNGVAVG